MIKIRNKAYRRKMKKFKDARLKSIIMFPGYNPTIGYIDVDYINGRKKIVGTHIKYPKHSHAQKFYKRYSNRTVRRSNDIPHKGNGYRKCFDYWWTLY